MTAFTSTGITLLWLPVTQNDPLRSKQRSSLPYLKPGLRLLDVGCGPGSITVGLAQRVVPATAIGIDRSASVIDTARAFLAERPVSNLSFEVGNIYQHRFDEASFDVILRAPGPTASQRTSSRVEANA
jgi:ubiquinone/menaquinone biosynthesis C-methylase UbiE